MEPEHDHRDDRKHFDEDVLAAEEAGMDGHIARRIDIAVMQKTIAEVLAGRKA